MGLEKLMRVIYFKIATFLPLKHKGSSIYAYLFVSSILTLFPAARKPLFSWGLIVVFIIFDSLVLLETIIPRYYLIPPPSRILDYIP